MLETHLPPVVYTVATSLYDIIDSKVSLLLERASTRSVIEAISSQLIDSPRPSASFSQQICDMITLVRRSLVLLINSLLKESVSNVFK